MRIPRAQEILGVERKVHTAEHLASAMFFLGAPAGGDSAGAADAVESSGDARDPTAMLHPFAFQPGEDLARRTTFSPSPNT